MFGLPRMTLILGQCETPSSEETLPLQKSSTDQLMGNHRAPIKTFFSKSKTKHVGHNHIYLYKFVPGPISIKK